MQEKTVTIALEGRIDSGNSAEVEKRIFEELGGRENVPVTLDASGLSYISSAGLRVILRVRKVCPALSVINVCPEVYDILDMTGFTEMMTVEKAYRVVSVEGCEEIGRGANGTVYRIDKDNVVKVYNNADALEDIRHEREMAKLALILGIPTAISYDVVRVGESYGSVFELLNASSFSKILSTEPDRFDWCVAEYVKMLKKIHGTLVPAGKLPDMKTTAEGWAAFMQDHLPGEAGEKLLSLIRAVPHDDHMIHGDYHTGNLELQNDEVLLIDMDTLAVGHPIFELASIYNSFVGYSEADPGVILKFQGFDQKTGRAFWRAALAAYLGTKNERKLREVEDKARIVGYTRMIRRSIRRKAQETEEGRREIDLWTKELLELLDRYDTLLYSPCELELEAARETLPEAEAFVEEHLEAVGCPVKVRMQIGIAVEEIFINVASYAYAPGKGNVKIRVETTEDPKTAVITFTDSGVPYDPLQKEDPDVTLSAEDREVGGLGIFMTKKLMDEVTYLFRDGKNILTLRKNL